LAALGETSSPQEPEEPRGEHIRKIESGERPPREFLRAAKEEIRLRRRTAQQEYENDDTAQREQPGPDADGVPADVHRLWAGALAELQLQMARATFDTWLRGSRVIKAGDGCLTIAVRHAHAVDWLQNRLLPVVERTVARLEGRESKITFVTEAQKDAFPLATEQSSPGD
jgi:hypothetical protein